MLPSARLRPRRLSDRLGLVRRRRQQGDEAARSARLRFGQSGRDQCIAYRQQGGGRADASRRRRQRLARRVSRAALRDVVRRRRVDGACRCVGRIHRTSLSRLSPLRRRQGRRDGCRHHARAVVAGRTRARHDLARDGVRIQDQLDRRADRIAAGADRRVLRLRQLAHRLDLGADRSTLVLAAPGEHSAVAVWRRRIIGR